MEKINLVDKLAPISEQWRPRIVGNLNGQEVKLVKFKGAFPWHHHEREDELFLALNGSFQIEFCDRTVRLDPGEFLIIPCRIEHCPVAEEKVEVLLFEPAATRNTGNVEDELFTVPLDARL